MKNIIEAIISKSKLFNSTLEEDILKDLMDPQERNPEKTLNDIRNIFELDKNTLTIHADNIGKEYRYARERLGLENIKLGEFCDKYDIKNIIIENNTGYLLSIRSYDILNFKGINIINKGKTNVTIYHVKNFKGGSLRGDIYLRIYEDNSKDPFDFIDIPMYYPILVDTVKLDGGTLIQLLRKIETELPTGHVFEYILQKNGRYVQKLYVSKGIAPEDFKKNYHTSEYKGNGYYYGFPEVKTRRNLVYCVTKY